MKALDLFCGLGGWSDGLTMEGFEVLGVEINQEIADLYKHPVICEDVRNLDPKDFMGYDLIVGSPPCRDFSKFALKIGHKWKDPPNPERGMELINAFLTFVEVAQPKYWLLENVPKVREYLEIKPRCLTAFSKQRYRCLWGTFPAFLVSRDLSLPNMAFNVGYTGKRTSGKYAKWENAYIPRSISRALGRAVASSLMPTETQNAESTNKSLM